MRTLNVLSVEREPRGEHGSTGKRRPTLSSHPPPLSHKCLARSRASVTEPQTSIEDPLLFTHGVMRCNLTQMESSA